MITCFHKIPDKVGLTVKPPAKKLAAGGLKAFVTRFRYLSHDFTAMLPENANKKVFNTLFN